MKKLTQTKRLFFALINVGIAGDHYVAQLRRTEAGREHRPQPKGYVYELPAKDKLLSLGLLSDRWDPPRLEPSRDEDPTPVAVHQGDAGWWTEQHDRYHYQRVHLELAIGEALEALAAATPEINSSGVSDLDQTSTRVARDLAEVRGAFPSLDHAGEDFPSVYLPQIVERMPAAVQALWDRRENLRAFIVTKTRAKSFAITEETRRKRNRGDPANDMNAIPSKERALLESLYERKAIDKACRCTLERLVKTAGGSERNAHRGITELKKWEYVLAEVGSAGGYWLTEKGIRAALAFAERSQPSRTLAL